MIEAMPDRRKYRIIPAMTLFWVLLTGSTVVRCNSGGQLAFDSRGLGDSDNSAPVAIDLSLTATVGIPQTASLPATDPEGDVLTFRIVTEPAIGDVELLDDRIGLFMYTAISPGSDSFGYVANDGLDDSNVGTVTIAIEEAQSAIIR